MKSFTTLVTLFAILAPFVQGNLRGHRQTEELSTLDLFKVYIADAWNLKVLPPEIQKLTSWTLLHKSISIYFVKCIETNRRNC